MVQKIDVSNFLSKKCKLYKVHTHAKRVKIFNVFTLYMYFILTVFTQKLHKSLTKPSNNISCLHITHSVNRTTLINIRLSAQYCCLFSISFLQTRSTPNFRAEFQVSQSTGKEV